MANYFPVQFSYKNGSAFLGSIPVKDIVETYGSPLYILDGETIVQNCRKFLDPLSNLSIQSRVLYACKANLTVGLAQFLNQQGKVT